MSVAPTLLLLPGLDGTGQVFAPFLALAGARSRRVLTYPNDQRLGYDALVERVVAQLPDEPFVVLGESFSGPVALKLAARAPAALRGVVLVASFAVTPIRAPRVLAAGLAPLVTLVTRGAPPRWIVRRYLAGPDADASLVELFRAAGRAVAPRVLAGRMLAIVDVDVRRELATCPVPILYLGGTHDALVAPTVAASLRVLRSTRALEVVTLDAPHLVLQRQPARAWEVIDAFLARLSPSV